MQQKTVLETQGSMMSSESSSDDDEAPSMEKTGHVLPVPRQIKTEPGAQATSSVKIKEEMPNPPPIPGE